MNDADSDAIAELGRELGVFFQLQDDLLDLVGDKGRELPATDLAEGKISWPVAWAKQHATPAHSERLMAIVRAPRGETSAVMVEEALGLLRDSGALAACVAEVERRARLLLAGPFIAAVPGLVQRVLEPIAHALSDPDLARG